MENYLIPKIKEAKEVETNRHRKMEKTKQDEQTGLANLWIAVNKYRIKNNEHKILQDAYLAGYKAGCRHSKNFAGWNTKAVI